MPTSTRASPSASASSSAPGATNITTRTTSPNDHHASASAKRRRFTRSKNGCLTCKRRKVRCDERQPTCQRCETEDRECLGYSGPPIPRIADARAAQSLRQAADGLTSLGSIVVHGSSAAGTDATAAPASSSSSSSSTSNGLIMPSAPSQLQQGLGNQGFAGSDYLSSSSTATPQITTHHQQQQHLGAQSDLSQLDDWLSRIIDTTHPSMSGPNANGDPNNVAATAWHTSNLFEWMPPEFSNMYAAPSNDASEASGQAGLQAQNQSQSIPQSILFQQHAQQGLPTQNSASPTAGHSQSHHHHRQSQQQQLPHQHQLQQPSFLTSSANMPFRAPPLSTASPSPEASQISRQGASSSPSASLRSLGAGGRSHRADERDSDSTLQQRLKQLCTSALQLEAVSRFFNHVARCFHLLPTDVNNWRLVYAELCCSSELTFKLVTAVGLISLSLCGPRNRRPLAYAMLTQCLGEWQRLVRRGEAVGWKKGGLSDLETLEVLAGAIMIGHFEQFDNGIGNHTISCMSVCRDLIDFAISAPPSESPVDQSPGSAFRFCVRAFLWWDTLSRTMGPGSGGDYPRKLFDAVRAWEDAETEDVTEMVQCICGWPLDLLEAVARTTALSQAVRTEDVMSPTSAAAAAAAAAAGGAATVTTPSGMGNGRGTTTPSFTTLNAPIHSSLGGSSSAQSILSLSPHTEESAVAEARSIETQIRCSRPRAVLQDTMLTAELRYIIFEVLQAGALVYFSRVLIADGDTKRVQPEINQVVRFLRRRDVPASTMGPPGAATAVGVAGGHMHTLASNDDSATLHGSSPNAMTSGAPPSHRGERSTTSATTPATSVTPSTAGPRSSVNHQQEASCDNEDRSAASPSGGEVHGQPRSSRSRTGVARTERSGADGGGGSNGGVSTDSSQSNSPRQRPALLSAEVEKKGLWRERAPDGALLWSYIQAAQVCDEAEETSCRATIERWRKFADCGALDLYPELLEEIWVRRQWAKAKGSNHSADELWAAVVRDRRWKQLLLF